MTNGTAVRHYTALKRLLEAVLLPTRVAIMKCPGQQKSDNHVAQGNDAADRAAKVAGGYTKQLDVSGQTNQTSTDHTRLSGDTEGSRSVRTDCGEHTTDD